jgi:hypothetical protein
VIEGTFAEGSGLPVVNAEVWLFDVDARMDVQWVVDITLPRTALSTFDLASLQSLAKRAASPEQDEQTRAILTLRHGDGTRSGFFLDLDVSDVDYSRLGRDVLDRTILVFDPRGGNLNFEVLEADL